MTIGAWVLFLLFAAMIMACACFIAVSVDTKTGWIISIIAGVVISILLFVGIRWWCLNTAAGQRALKSQESNFSGGLNRVVTVYSYDGDEIKRWEGQFDVTENDQETWFDIDGRRVIIQGGIIINEEIDPAEGGNENN